MARTNMKTTKKQNSLFSKRRGVSPILATVILLGISVVGGGLAFAVFSSGMTTASQNNVIAVENAQAVKGTDHADITATVKNAGGKPWTKLEMTVSKTELSEPILYETLHENAAGCTTDQSGGTTNSCSTPFEGRDNPLRMQWLVALDKKSGTEGEADVGEGASVGRKLVFESKDSYRTITVLNGTSVGAVFGMGNGTYNGNIESGDQCNNAFSSTTWVDCSNTFDALDSSTDGFIACRNSGGDSGGGDDVVCKVFTHVNLGDDPISSGESRYFYADAFVNEITGLHNQVVRVGDNIVVNISSEDVDGGTARVQTIIKVTGS